MRFQAGALATLGLLAVMTHAFSAWRQPATDQAAEVEKLDRELSAAGVRGDVDATARLVADAAVFVEASGKTSTKTDMLDSMKSADYKLESENIEDMRYSANIRWISRPVRLGRLRIDGIPPSLRYLSLASLTRSAYTRIRSIGLDQRNSDSQEVRG